MSQSPNKTPKRWSHFLSRPPALLLLLGMVLALYLLLGQIGSRLQTRAAGLPILDVRLSYTPNEVRALFDALGEDGRAAYQQMHILPDLAFPLIYMLFFFNAITWLAGQARLKPATGSLLAHISLLAGAFDLLENTLILMMVWRHPSFADSLARTAGIVTPLKFAFFAASVLLLFVLLALAIARRKDHQHA